MRDLTEEIIEFAQQHDFIVGVCDSKPLFFAESVLKNHNTPFTRYSTEERINPRITMPDCESIIVVGLGYGRKLNFTMDDIPRGEISVGAYGMDYHVLIRDFLNKMADFMLSRSGFSYQIHVDTGPLAERALLAKSGLGWLGRSGNIISRRFGSFFFAGYMLTSLRLTPTPGFSIGENHCGSCVACVNACPGGAIGHCGGFQFEKCASYLTQKKGGLTKSEEIIVGVRIYGCDVCQNVCPYNADAYMGEITDIDAVRPVLTEFLNLTSEQFDRRYGYTAMGWRGRKTLIRNAAIGGWRYGILER